MSESQSKLLRLIFWVWYTLICLVAGYVFGDLVSEFNDCLGSLVIRCVKCLSKENVFGH